MGQHYKVAMSVHYYKSVPVLTFKALCPAQSATVCLGRGSHCATTQGSQRQCELCFGWLLEFYILVTSKVLSGWILTCDSAH